MGMYKKHISESKNKQINNYSSQSDPLWETIEKEYHNSKLNNAHLDKSVDKDLKIIRIFISSTFKDFYNERDVLVKSVFPRLRKWCEEQGLYLVECDLRWGVPSDATNLEAVSYCLDEIEKSRQETNNHNFFLCLIGNRYGWVPDERSLVDTLKIKYNFIEESSVTLMEIIHGVLRSGTENKLFMMRNPNILKFIPDNHLEFYEESDSKMKTNVQQQKDFIVRHFSQTGCVKDYEINYQSTATDSVSGKERLVFSNFDDFGKTVEDYFKEKISAFKTVNQLATSSEDQNENLIHKSFLLSLIKDSMKRDDYIVNLSREIISVSSSTEPTNPIILLTGEAGSGKSTIMGHLIDHFLRQRDRKVFYHFCAASNTSHSQSNIVSRLSHWMESSLNILPMKNSSEEDEIHLTDLLLRDDLEPIIVFVDAVDELYDATLAKSFPKSTAKNVLLVISCLIDNESVSAYSQLSKNEYSSRIITVEPMNRCQLGNIVSAYLRNFGKKLDTRQLDRLMGFSSSTNPLWLLSACEELRIHGDYSTLFNLIGDLPETIADLNRMVIKRLTEQDKSNVVKTLLQLLTVSRAGLWESLVKDILAAVLDQCQPISHSLWSDVVWQLKGFLQIQSIPLPLIKLRHRVMKQSIEAELAMDEAYRTSLHQKLATFLETVLDSASDIFLADYMYHLIQSGARNRLIDFMRSRKSWTIIKQFYIRSRIMSSMRCINTAVAQSDPLKMCVFCATKSGDLSIYGLNKNSCVFCGNMVMNSNANDTYLYPCQFHKNARSCSICSRILGPSQGENLKVCRTCKMQTLGKNCGILVKENDILFRQQIGFSKNVYRIESLV